MCEALTWNVFSLPWEVDEAGARVGAAGVMVVVELRFPGVPEVLVGGGVVHESDTDVKEDGDELLASTEVGVVGQSCCRSHWDAGDQISRSLRGLVLKFRGPSESSS